MKRGIVSLVFRCRPIAGEVHPTEEAIEVAWLDAGEVTRRMTEAFAIRLLDAISGNGPQVRVHDGETVARLTRKLRSLVLRNETGCPAQYATDRRTFAVQGWKVGDPRALTDLVDVHDEEVFVEIPNGLLRCDDGDPGEAVGADRPGRPAMYATPRDTYLVRGWEVTDAEAIADLIDVRDNEFYVEVPKTVLRHPENVTREDKESA